MSVNKLNILVTSAGRRVKIVQYLKDTLSTQNGKVIATDCDLNAPALYFADEYELIPRIDDENYLSSILALCEKHRIDGIISLIDPELEILAMNKAKFEEIGTKLILSPLDMIEYSFDKQETYHYLSELGIATVPTYSNLESVVSLLGKGELIYPLVVKPGKGSASIGINIVHNQLDLKNGFSKEEDLIIQPFYNDREFGIDVYIDTLSGKIVDLFIKEKIVMRSGETDKSVAIHNDEIESLVKELISKTNFRGPIDIDCFEYNGEYYISEVNPRFGGGYPHAHEIGCNFMEYIVTNLEGNLNEQYEGYKYEKDYVMMKYDDVVLTKKASNLGGIDNAKN